MIHFNALNFPMEQKSARNADLNSPVHTHLKHRLVQCVNSVFRFLCSESLAAQRLQFLAIAVCFMALKKRGFESPQQGERRRS